MLCGDEIVAYADGTGVMCLSVDWPERNSLRARQLISQDTEKIHAKVSAGEFAVHADIIYPAASASITDVPVGDYLVEGTAWKTTDPTVGGVLLSYGLANAAVSAGQTTPVGITLAPSSVTFPSPADFQYGLAEGSSQTVSVSISFTNWPLSLRQAYISVSVTDYPAAPFTVFDSLCIIGQTLEDVTVRECSGILPVTSEIANLPPGSARISVFVDGFSQETPDNVVWLLSDPLPAAPLP